LVPKRQVRARAQSKQARAPALHPHPHTRLLPAPPSCFNPAQQDTTDGMEMTGTDGRTDRWSCQSQETYPGQDGGQDQQLASGPRSLKQVIHLHLLPSDQSSQRCRSQAQHHAGRHSQASTSCSLDHHVSLNLTRSAAQHRHVAAGSPEFRAFPGGLAPSTVFAQALAEQRGSKRLQIIR
jgi:hypothetical protein